MPADPRVLTDGEHRPRLVMLEEPLQFASGQPAVLRRMAGLLRLLREVAWRAPQGLVSAQVHRLVRRVAEVAGESTDVSDDERAEWIEAVEVAPTGRGPALWPWETERAPARADLTR